MNECFDCGELFQAHGGCPMCGSQNVGIDYEEQDDDLFEEGEFEEDEYEF